jgi:adenylate cyclase, class 2
MQSAGGIEYEVQFSNFNKKEIIKKLKSLKQKQIHSKMLYRVAYMYASDKKSFVRARMENNKITITKKILCDPYPEEYEIELSKNNKFSDIIQFIKKIAPENSHLCIVEKYREKWSLPGNCHELTFDEWPGLPTFIEVDCSDKKSLMDTLKYLNLDINNAFRKGAFTYYSELYDIDPKKMFDIDIIFKGIHSELKPLIKKNKGIIKKLDTIYKKKEYNDTITLSDIKKYKK